MNKYIKNSKNILLIISGSIAAYKIPHLIRLLKNNAYNLRIILTNGGEQFVTLLTLLTLNENEIYSSSCPKTWEKDPLLHINCTRWAELVLVAPASANIIAKYANGICDDLATTTLNACNKKVLIAPAMNPEMWQNFATQQNVTKLKKAGVQFLGPGDGDTACKEDGLGRMIEPEQIVKIINSILSTKIKKLTNKKIIVTSGATVEPIDPARFLSNYSSGKQGLSIAIALEEDGADVTLIRTKHSVNSGYYGKSITVSTGQEMYQAVMDLLPAECFISAAAVSDWKLKNISKEKIKKSSFSEKFHLELVKNIDILKTVSLLNDLMRPKLVIGFAAETENIIENAKQKIIQKKCDWIFANQINKEDSVFCKDYTELTFLTKKGIEGTIKASKIQAAKQISDLISKII